MEFSLVAAKSFLPVLELNFLVSTGEEILIVLVPTDWTRFSGNGANGG